MNSRLMGALFLYVPPLYISAKDYRYISQISEAYLGKSLSSVKEEFCALNKKFTENYYGDRDGFYGQKTDVVQYVLYNGIRAYSMLMHSLVDISSDLAFRLPRIIRILDVGAGPGLGTLAICRFIEAYNRSFSCGKLGRVYLDMVEQNLFAADFAGNLFRDISMDFSLKVNIVQDDVDWFLEHNNRMKYYDVIIASGVFTELIKQRKDVRKISCKLKAMLRAEGSLMFVDGALYRMTGTRKLMKTRRQSSQTKG